MNRLDSSAENLALITSRVRGQSDDAGQEALQQRVQPGVENEDRGPDEDDLDKQRRPANDCHIGIRCAPDVIFDPVNEERAEEEAGAGAPAVRSCFGLWKISSGDPSSMIRPASMNRIRFATSLANPISCVTTIIVMPSLARAAIASSTSRMYSGSRADVGSSNNMALGFMARVRSMATRCCWPPDNCAGYAS